MGLGPTGPAGHPALSHVVVLLTIAVGHVTILLRFMEGHVKDMIQRPKHVVQLTVQVLRFIFL